MKKWVALIVMVGSLGLVGCGGDDDGGGGAAPVATTPANNQNCRNGYGFNNNYGYNYNGYLNTCTQEDINRGYRIVNGVRVNCYNNNNIGYNGTCYNDNVYNHSCTQAELNQGFWVDSTGNRRVCNSNFLNGGFQVGHNFDISESTRVCQDHYGPSYYAVFFPGLNVLKCVSGFTYTSALNYYQNSYYNGSFYNPWYYGGYNNVYQACRVGTTVNGCHCGNIGGTLGWVSAGVQWGICL